MTFLPKTAAPSPSRAAPSGDPRARLILPWFALTLVLVVAGLAALALSWSPGVADTFFLKQDIPVVIATGAVLIVLRFAPSRLLAAAAVSIPLTPRVAVAVMAAATALVAAVGWFVVFHAYPMSMDEFMSVFDATIFRHGGSVAYLPQAWRPYIFPLQPQFTLYAAHGAAWVSFYLPVNALLRAALDLVGAPWAVGAVCAVVSVVTVFALARRFWPERPDAAVVAALMLATSSQFLITAMTPYAMSAHLAFNLVWLWLFIRPGLRSQAGALAVGFAASGLHQVIFHPLFAAPFVLGLWLERKWARAAAFTAGYGAIVLFWILYWKLALPPGGAGLHGQVGPGFELLLIRLQGMLANFNLAGAGFMAKNLLRLVVWQNPMLPILTLAGLGAAVRAKGVFRALIGGVVLTLVVMWVLLPYQGHGWGYRYLHGFLGAFALIAALGWIRLTGAPVDEERPVVQGLLVILTVFSVLVVAPWRAAQASAMTRPYAAAARAIAATPADVVLVDPSGLFYATDLVRNDPLLQSAPKLMDLGVLQAPQLASLCAEHKVALFERREGLALGIDPSGDKTTPHTRAMRALLDSLKCGARSTPVP